MKETALKALSPDAQRLLVTMCVHGVIAELPFVDVCALLEVLSETYPEAYQQAVERAQQASVPERGVLN